MPVRSKKALVGAAVEEAMVAEAAALGRKGGKKKRAGKAKEGEKGFLQRASDADSALEDSSSGGEGSSGGEEEERSTSSPSSLLASLEGLEEGEVASLAWVAGKLEEEAKDREEEEDEEPEEVAVVPVEEELVAALSTSSITSVMAAAGLSAPGPGERWWRIPPTLPAAMLRARATVLRRAAGGERGPEAGRELAPHLLGAVSQGPRSDQASSLSLSSSSSSSSFSSSLSS